MQGANNTKGAPPAARLEAHSDKWLKCANFFTLVVFYTVATATLEHNTCRIIIPPISVAKKGDRRLSKEFCVVHIGGKKHSSLPSSSLLLRA